jgi:hypothetical protein
MWEYVADFVALRCPRIAMMVWICVPPSASCVPTVCRNLWAETVGRPIPSRSPAAWQAPELK